MNKQALTRPNPGAADSIKVGYSDFLKLFHVDDSNEWLLLLRVAPDGVWVKGPISNSVPPATRAALTDCPSGDPSTPVLSWPCTFGQIQEIAKFYGEYPSTDPFLLADFVAKSTAQLNKEAKKQESELEPRQRKSMLAIILALAESKKAIDLADKKAPQQIARLLEERGLPGPKARAIQGILRQACELLEEI